MERRNIEVPPAHAGEAVARIIHDGLAVPHSVAKGLIDAGCVTVNGRPVKTHGRRCEGGDVIEIVFDPGRTYHPTPAPRHGHGFRVVHEDREIVVVNKAPGILSSPAAGEIEESLAESIAASLRQRGIRKPQLFMVHRLDRHTSGLLVLARTPRALESLTAQFESRQAGREYVAIVAGRVQNDAGTIQSWLVEDPKSLSVRTTPLRGAGKRAITHFEVIERFETATLVRVRLETGRKHQIRVHFAEIGHPILGDRRYGVASPLIPRVALHAEQLSFKHPHTLAAVHFDAQWPDDLLKLTAGLRKGGGAEKSAGAPGGSAADGVPARAGTKIPSVVVLPRGLTITDRLPARAPAAVGTPERAPAAAAASSGFDRRAARARGARSRDEDRETDERRKERLLRERSVGSRPSLSDARRRGGPPGETRGRGWSPPPSGPPRQGSDARRWREDEKGERRRGSYARREFEDSGRPLKEGRYRRTAGDSEQAGGRRGGMEQPHRGRREEAHGARAAGVDPSYGRRRMAERGERPGGMKPPYRGKPGDPEVGSSERPKPPWRRESGEDRGTRSRGPYPRRESGGQGRPPGEYGYRRSAADRGETDGRGGGMKPPHRGRREDERGAGPTGSRPAWRGEWGDDRGTPSRESRPRRELGGQGRPSRENGYRRSTADPGEADGRRGGVKPPRHGGPEDGRGGGPGGPRPPWRRESGDDRGARSSDSFPRRGPGGAARGSGAQAQARKSGAAGARKPWEFRQKGMTIRSARRRKIKAAKAKGKPR